MVKSWKHREYNIQLGSQRILVLSNGSSRDGSDEESLEQHFDGEEWEKGSWL